MSATEENGSSLRHGRQVKALEDSIDNPVPPGVAISLTGPDLEECAEQTQDRKGREFSVKASQTIPNRTKPFVILVACVAALGGFVFGHDIAGAGAAFVMTGFRLHFGWECADGDTECTPAMRSQMDLDRALINGLFGIGAAFGALINPAIVEAKGRRLSLSIAAIVFVLGASIQTAAPAMAVMWVGRVFSGMGIGVLSMCAPVCIAECSPEHIRGALGTLWQLAITAGIACASACNLGLKNWIEGWRLSYGGNIVFAIIMLICLAFMPESPRWLAAHRTEEETRKALNRMRFEDEIELEMTKIAVEIEQEQKMGEAPWSEVFSTENSSRRRVMLGIVLMAFQQLSGVNAVCSTVRLSLFGSRL